MTFNSHLKMVLIRLARGEVLRADQGRPKLFSWYADNGQRTSAAYQEVNTLVRSWVIARMADSETRDLFFTTAGYRAWYGVFPFGDDLRKCTQADITVNAAQAALV